MAHLVVVGPLLIVHFVEFVQVALGAKEVHFVEFVQVALGAKEVHFVENVEKTHDHQLVHHFQTEETHNRQPVTQSNHYQVVADHFVRNYHHHSEQKIH